MKQVVKWTAEGAVKCDFHKVFCDAAGGRYLPGICWYPTKRTGSTVNQGGTADNLYYSSLTDRSFCQGRFFAPLAETPEEYFYLEVQTMQIVPHIGESPGDRFRQTIPGAAGEL